MHLTESALAAVLGWAFINDSDDARNTPAEPFYEAARAAGAEVAVHDPWVDPATSPDAPPGLSRDLEGVLSGADAVVVFAGHKEYRGLVPARVKGLCGCTWPVIVDGRNGFSLWLERRLTSRALPPPGSGFFFMGVIALDWFLVRGMLLHQICFFRPDIRILRRLRRFF